MNAVDIALEQLTKAKTQIAEQYPPPYDFPSDIGRVAQLVDDSINTAKIIKKKMAKDLV